MGSRNIISIIIQFLVYTAVQLLLFRNVVLFQNAFCYLYIATMLVLPVETGRIAQLFIGLAIGLLLDLFYDTLGMHAFACVFLAYVRINTLNYLQPSAGYEVGAKPLLREMGLTWFMTYSSILILGHHFAFFIIETSDLSKFPTILIKTISSSIFTLSVILIIQLVFYQKRRRA